MDLNSDEVIFDVTESARMKRDMEQLPLRELVGGEGHPAAKPRGVGAAAGGGGDEGEKEGEKGLELGSEEQDDDDVDTCAPMAKRIRQFHGDGSA